MSTWMRVESEDCYEEEWSEKIITVSHSEARVGCNLPKLYRTKPALPQVGTKNVVL